MTAKKKTTKKTPVKKVTTAPVTDVAPAVTSPPNGAKRGPKPGVPRAPLAVQPVMVDQETKYGMSRIKMYEASWKGEKKIFTERPAANAWIKEQKATFKVPAYAKTFKNLHGKLVKMDFAEVPQEKYAILEALKSAYEMLVEPYYNLAHTVDPSAETDAEVAPEVPATPTVPLQQPAFPPQQQPTVPTQPAVPAASPLSFLQKAATPPLP